MFKCKKCGALYGKKIDECFYCGAMNTLYEMSLAEVQALSKPQDKAPVSKTNIAKADVSKTEAPIKSQNEAQNMSEKTDGVAKLNNKASAEMLVAKVSKQENTDKPATTEETPKKKRKSTRKTK